MAEIEGDRAREGSRRDTGYHWFTRLWAAAVLFHLAGNPAHIQAWTVTGQLEALMGLLAVSLLFRPGDRRLALMAALHLPVVVLKAPVVGNHEMIEALIHVAILGSMAARRSEWPTVFVPGARAILITAYGLIAFSKLNTGFLDPAVSCAVVFGDELGRFAGIVISDYTALSHLVIWGTVLTELAVPVLLVRRARFAVPVAIAFHFLLALDPVGHVYDFSATLLPLFLLFLPVGFTGFASARLGRLDPDLLRKMLALAIIAEGLILVLDVRIWLVAWPAWLLVGGTAWWLTYTYARTNPVGERQPLFAPLHPLLAVVVVVTLLNGAAPYLELKTASAFNMYSNLLTAQGRSNHLLVPATFPLTSGQDELAEIVSTTDARLDRYREQGLLIPVPSLLIYLENHPGTSADIVIEGRAVAIPAGSSSEVLGSPPSWFESKLGHFRAVDLDGPKSCLRWWEAAH